MVSSKTSIGTSARTARVSCPSHSPASGPTAIAPTRTRALGIGRDLHEPRTLRSLVRRQPAAHDLVPRAATAPRRSIVAHRPDLRIGEDRSGNRAVVGLDVLPGDVRRGDPCLVLADMRQQGDAGGVTDRPRAVRRRMRSSTVMPLCVCSTPSCSSPRPCDVWPAARRDQQLLALERLPESSVSGIRRRRLHRSPPSTRTRIPSSPKRSARSSPHRRRAGRADGRCARRASPQSPCGGRTARARRRPVRRRARRGSPAPRSAQTASRFVQYSTSSMPSSGGTRRRRARRDHERRRTRARRSPTPTTPGRGHARRLARAPPLAPRATRVPRVVASLGHLVAPPEARARHRSRP